MKLTNVLLIISLIAVLPSCVQKSTYEEAISEIDRLKKIETNLEFEIEQKNNLLRTYQADLQSCKSFVSGQVNNNNKGKDELEFVRGTLDDIVYSVQNCQNSDDLYQIKSNLESLKSKVGNYIFFNY